MTDPSVHKPKHEFAHERLINPFVYDKVGRYDMDNPTIPAWLHESYAQCYEDVMVIAMIKAYGLKLGSSFKLSYVEVGANHPVCTSSSYMLQRTFNCGGILVEPNPHLAAQLRKHRPGDIVIEAAVHEGPEKEVNFFIHPENEVSSVKAEHIAQWRGGEKGVSEIIKVQTVKINDILARMNADVYPLFIDVEGMDLSILKAIDFNKHRPFIVQVEPSEDNNPGTADEMMRVMRANNYTLIAVNFVNMIFYDMNNL